MRDLEDMHTCLPNFKSLESDGFVLVKSVFSGDELLNLRQIFEQASPTHTNNNYPFVRKLPAGSAVPLKSRIKEIMWAISEQTNICCDTIFEGFFWPTETNNGVKFNWHQDHETYFLSESHYNYLNFYIVVDKEVDQHSNLSLIPFTKLKENDPRLFEQVEGKGACIFWKPENMKSRLKAVGDFSFDLTLLHDNEVAYVRRDDMHGTVLPISVDLEELAVTPHLSAGDLLVMRGDVIHKTQDSRCRRLALSIRCVNHSESLLTWKALLNMTRQKAKMMRNNPQWAMVFGIMAARGITKFNFAAESHVWEKPDMSKLSIFEKMVACLSTRLIQQYFNFQARFGKRYQFLKSNSI